MNPFSIFVIKNIWVSCSANVTKKCCHGNHISQILGKVAVLNRVLIDLHIHTAFFLYVINIIDMGMGGCFVFYCVHLCIKLTINIKG